MNSISFSPSLPTFTQKHGSKSKSHRILAHRRNFLTPKFYQCSTSKCKMQPMYSKPLLVAALGDTNMAAQQPSSKPPSPLKYLVYKFYKHLNSKDVRRLERLFDPDCVVEDEAYYKPLEGQNVHKFFEKLTEAMGQHVVFAIDRICEGDESSIAVMWHLEWNGEFIPFTKGCSMYTCSKNNNETFFIQLPEFKKKKETFVIRRAHVFMEAPFKPGDFALEMLKIIIALFDRFPKLAESYLRKHDALVFYMLNIYKFIVQPLMRAVRLYYYYTLMLACVAKILATVLTIISVILCHLSPVQFKYVWRNN